MKTMIIGHRGAAGLALENTIESIKAAIEYNVAAIEFDVRLTADNRWVLCHDSTTRRVSDTDVKVRELTLSEIQQIKLKNGEHIPLLQEVMGVVGQTPVIIELKVEGGAEELFAVLNQFPGANVTIVSFHHQEIASIKAAHPQQRVYLAERTKPIEIVQLAKAFRVDGLDLYFWLLNPLTYWQARRANLEVMVYTLNNRLLVRFIHLLYPKVAICTNHPEYFLPKKRRQV